jgi:hypothetical protein
VVAGDGGVMKAILFKGTVSAFNEQVIEQPGFSHWSAPFKIRVYWYPWEEWRRTAYVFAKNRTKAVRAFMRAGSSEVRDVSIAGRYECPASIAKVIFQP